MPHLTRAEELALYARQFTDGITRAEAALFLGVGKGSAKVYLETAVSQGLMTKAVGYAVRHHAGWIYFPVYPETSEDRA